LTGRPAQSTLEAVKRRSSRLVITLATVLACAFVGSTSFASYRVSMGAKQCCKSHCRHAMPKSAAEQCCRTHPAAGPAASTSATSPDSVAPTVAIVTRIGIGAPLVVPSRAAEGLGPPGGTLFSQHTFLAL
jgi:hypothetical protein